MTDYKFPSKLPNGLGRPMPGIVSWKSLWPFYLLVVLIFAVINGFLKSVSFGKSLSYGWDGVSSFAVVVGGKSDSFFVFQKDPKRIVHVVLGSIFNDESPEILLKRSSVYAGTSIKNYIGFGKDSEEDFLKGFEDFVSYTTPIKIITVGFDSNTNISRVDALKLWWQLKGTRVEEVDVLKTEAFDKSGSGSRVLGTTSDAVARVISPYLENMKILKENIDIEIVNASDDVRSVSLAESFILSVGGRVTDVRGDTNNTSGCTVSTNVAESYTASYLEKTFDCDIKETNFDLSRDIVTVTIGQDFAKNYLE